MWRCGRKRDRVINACEYISEVQLEIKDDKITMIASEKKLQIYDYKIENENFMIKENKEFEETRKYKDY